MEEISERLLRLTIEIVNGRISFVVEVDGLR